RAAADPDPQVRRLAMQAIGAGALTPALAINGLADPAPIVRREALRAVYQRAAPDACNAAIRAAKDADLSVSLNAIDALGTCRSVDAIGALESTAAASAKASDRRASHRNAHAIVALASAAPEKARPLVPHLAQSGSPAGR